MQITDNLKNDISDAPAWFHDAIIIKPSEKILEDVKGNLSYSVWPLSLIHISEPTRPY